MSDPRPDGGGVRSEPADKSRARPHESARAHVRGSARYTDDLRPPAGLLHLWPVQVPHAHARIVAIDTAPALALSGVVLALTHADVPGENDSGPVVHDEVLLPDREIVHWGQAVAWIAADSEELAREGAAAVRVEVEPLDAILTLEDAIAARGHLRCVT